MLKGLFIRIMSLLAIFAFINTLFSFSFAFSHLGPILTNNHETSFNVQQEQKSIYLFDLEEEIDEEEQEEEDRTLKTISFSGFSGPSLIRSEVRLFHINNILHQTYKGNCHTKLAPPIWLVNRVILR
jgi:hypothetical protein